MAGERQSAGVPIESLIGSLAAKSAKSKHTDNKYNKMREEGGEAALLSKAKSLGRRRDGKMEFTETIWLWKEGEKK